MNIRVPKRCIWCQNSRTQQRRTPSCQKDATQPEWTPSHLVKKEKWARGPISWKRGQSHFLIKTSRDAKKRGKKRSHLVKRPREPRNAEFSRQKWPRDLRRSRNVNFFPPKVSGRVCLFYLSPSRGRHLKEKSGCQICFAKKKRFRKKKFLHNLSNFAHKKAQGALKRQKWWSFIDILSY